MNIKLIQNLIRQAGHFDFNTKQYFYFFDKSDTEEFEIIKNAFWTRNSEEKITIQDLNLLLNLLSKRWERMIMDPIRQDCYLVIRSKVDRFFLEIAKEVANAYAKLMPESPAKNYYDFLMPTLKNSFQYSTSEKFRSQLAISENGTLFVSLADLKPQTKKYYSKSELFLLKRWGCSIGNEKNELSIESKSIESKDVSPDPLVNAIVTLLSNMAASSINLNDLIQCKKQQQMYFNTHVKNLNLEELTALSIFMNAVQLKKVDIKDSKFEVIRTGKLGYSNTSVWREMRHLVKCLIVEALLAKYKNSQKENDKINLPEEVYSKYADLLRQNTHHKYNYFKNPDSYNEFKKYFQIEKPGIYKTHLSSDITKNAKPG